MKLTGLSPFFQVVTQTISRDLDDINARVKEAATNLRRERVRLIGEKVKQVRISINLSR